MRGRRRVIKTNQLIILRRLFAALAHSIEKAAGNLGVSAEDPLQRLVGERSGLKPARIALFRAGEDRQIAFDVHSARLQCPAECFPTHAPGPGGR